MWPHLASSEDHRWPAILFRSGPAPRAGGGELQADEVTAEPNVCHISNPPFRLGSTLDVGAAMKQDARRVADFEQSAGPTPKELPDSSAGLSNDYLNHYVEVLMLIEMAPHDPSLGADLTNWWPVSYIEWFSSSQLADASKARAAYEGLPDDKRRRFERHLAAMETLATLAAFALQPPCDPEQASVVVDAASPALRRMITAASTFLDTAGRRLPDEQTVNEAEQVIDGILAMRPTAGAAGAKANESPEERDARAAAAGTRILVVEHDTLLRGLIKKLCCAPDIRCSRQPLVKRL